MPHFPYLGNGDNDPRAHSAFHTAWTTERHSLILSLESQQVHIEAIQLFPWKFEKGILIPFTLPLLSPFGVSPASYGSGDCQMLRKDSHHKFAHDGYTRSCFLISPVSSPRGPEFL